ncbi:uncharacterized protein LAESUDRAFT_761178 [Laetiporus sulphureus 93-53]|uniref:NAD(P)-binding protein n=1 Tax=Laetiporus sulphureus 93-53 TaxID=1314785 RepID=A0A165D8F7_9APHY|nr:uncharacterized protein LAESUDRAFT_761178 [Laetiporus sulphureus 93-53]KZT04328.1 hypothetical protein LAESUDRAFT_761178 [Laetiporus sulphureus 93-53]
MRAVLPTLKRTAGERNSDVRIVHPSSKEHFNAPNDVHLRNAEDFNVKYKDYSLAQYQRYSLTKLTEIVFVKELHRRLNAEGVPIIVMAIHPGVVNTEGVQKYAHSVGPIFFPIYSFITNAFYEHLEKGSYARHLLLYSIGPAVHAELSIFHGVHVISSGMVCKPSRWAEGPELPKEL